MLFIILLSLALIMHGIALILNLCNFLGDVQNYSYLKKAHESSSDDESKEWYSRKIKFKVRWVAVWGCLTFISVFTFIWMTVTSINVAREVEIQFQRTTIEHNEALEIKGRSNYKEDKP